MVFSQERKQPMSIIFSGVFKRLVAIRAKINAGPAEPTGPILWVNALYDEYKLIPDNVQPLEQFGSSSAISGDGNRAALSSPNSNRFISGGGVMNVYTWNGTSWNIDLLAPITPVGNNLFGFVVKISNDGNRIVSGAPRSTGTGAVYVFDWNGLSWDETILTPSIPMYQSFFGGSLDISDDGKFIIVGAHNHKHLGSNATRGAAILFEWNGANWIEKKIFLANAPRDYEKFGNSVAVSNDGNTVFIGAPHSFQTGYVYVYRWNGISWDQTIITGATPAITFGFYVSCGMNGNRFVANKMNDDKFSVFDWNGTSWDETVVQPNPTIIAHSGLDNIKITEDGYNIIAGDGTVDSSVPRGGKVYVFSLVDNEWTYRVMGPFDPSENAIFGYSVDFSADSKSIIVGALDESSVVSQGGAGYIFKIK